MKKKQQKEAYSLTKHIFFFFLLIGPLLLSNLITFLFLIPFRQLSGISAPPEILQNHSGTLIATELHTRNFLGVWERL
jgi:hypothetical protein